MLTINQQSVLEMCKNIILSTTTIRDMFPDNLPYLWDTLSPHMDNIENQATLIRKQIKEMQA